jgi:hypothetical protein
MNADQVRCGVVRKRVFSPLSGPDLLLEPVSLRQKGQ